jgi:hypothetical protein
MFDRVCTTKTTIANMLCFVTFAGTIPMHILVHSPAQLPSRCREWRRQDTGESPVLSFTDKRNSIMARVALFLSLIGLMLTTGAGAQEPAERPFKTVHLVTLDSAQEAKLTGTIAEFNAAIAKAGFPNARYRLYKVEGKQQGQYSLLWESSWSGRAEYEKIHNLPIYQQASLALKNLMPLMKDEAYNRFVEIPTNQ